MNGFDAIYKKQEGSTRQFSSFLPQTRQKTVRVESGESKVLIDCRGSGIITRIWMTFPGWFWRHWDPEAENDQRLLRTTIVRLWFDGQAEPSVEVPVGDFFGIGHCEYRQFTSKYIGMSSGGFYSYFPMPYAEGFRMELENLHERLPVDLFYNLEVREKAVSSDELRFHAAFSCGEREGWEEMEIADIRGQGHLAGCTVSVQGKPLQYLAYLEAPEYIYVDGGKDPAVCGTGMEDYFNGGWYFRNGEFSCETHGMPLKDTLRSMTSMYRFLEQDAVVFQDSLRMYFVNPWEKERLKPYRYSSVAYYYLTEAAPACRRLPGLPELTALYRVRDADFQSVP